MQTVLVIDDDESLRDTIGVLLEQEGFRAVLVDDGREGFEKALLLKPDLMLVDLRSARHERRGYLQAASSGADADADHRAERGGRRGG